MLLKLKEEVCAANLELAEKGVVIFTWGNVSGIDREKGLVVIKPSGIDYASMCPDDMVVVELSTGRTVEGKWKPSSDTATHLALYKVYAEINGIAHTHSVNAVAFAQAGLDIPALGTTHADHFHGPIPCTRGLSEKEVFEDYETNTGNVIIECFANRIIDPTSVPGALVKNHGPFTWGKSPSEAVFNAVVLEKIAEIAFKTLLLTPQATMQHYLLNKHYYRMHGPNATYGQK